MLIFGGSDPVSYTHLDVYKRQIGVKAVLLSAGPHKPDSRLDIGQCRREGRLAGLAVVYACLLYTSRAQGPRGGDTEARPGGRRRPRRLHRGVTGQAGRS